MLRVKNNDKDSIDNELRLQLSVKKHKTSLFYWWHVGRHIKNFGFNWNNKTLSLVIHSGYECSVFAEKNTKTRVSG